MSLRTIKEKFSETRKPRDEPRRPSRNTAPAGDNVTFFQGFEWYLPSDGKHYRRLQGKLERLKQLGVDQVWLPPGCKAGWQGSNGYDVYDAYDLGEFDQKGSRRTKFGDKKDLLDLSRFARSIDVKLCWDAILNHRSSADYTEKCQAVKVDAQDRRKEIGRKHEVEVWTGYRYDGRNDKYSSFKYHWYHFTGTDYEARLKSNENIYRFIGDNKPGWAKDVDDELGNYDFLMGNDLDYSQEDVRKDLQHWARWIVNEVGISGFRLDAVKHMSQSFLRDWIRQLDNHLQERLFFVGEYWRGDLNVLGPVIEKFKGRLKLFDVVLAGNLSNISHNPEAADLRKVFDDTLMKHYPSQAVVSQHAHTANMQFIPATFILNHDTQPRYERDHHVVPISPWFIPLGYALILLYETKAYPCVFWGDLYGLQSPHPEKQPQLPQPPSCLGVLPRLMLARKLWAYGKGTAYFDDPKCVGFVRAGIGGNNSHGEGIAVILNIGKRYAKKRMFVGEKKRGRRFTDVLGFAWGEVEVDARGWGDFPVGPRSVGVWLDDQGVGREEVERFDLR